MGAWLLRVQAEALTQTWTNEGPSIWTNFGIDAVQKAQETVLLHTSESVVTYNNQMTYVTFKMQNLIYHDF